MFGKLLFTMATAAFGGAALAAPFDQRLESRSSAAVLSNGQSDWPQLSIDGRYLCFTSLADNLTGGLPANGTRHVFRRDVITGSTLLIDFETTNVRAANGNAGNRSFISENGRWVVFDHDSNQLVAGDTNGARDVFVRDTATSTTTRISVASGGGQSNGDSVAGAISTDGRYVVFTSVATNLVGGDTNGVKDVFMHDRTTNTTVRMSVDSAEDQGNNACGDYPWIGSSPNFVVYSSQATDLVTNDTNAAADVFLRRGGGGAGGSTERLSVSAANVQGNRTSEAPVISRDNRYVAFHSSASNLVGADANGNVTDVFRKDLVTGAIQIASVDDAGNQPFGPSLWPSISQEGRCVSFATSEALDAVDVNSVFDVYVRNFTTSDTTYISRQSALGAGGNSSSHSSGISGDRKYVAFASDSSNLVAGDANALRDAFRYEYGTTAALLTLNLSFPGWAGPNDPKVQVELLPANPGDIVGFDPQPDPPGQYNLSITDFTKYDIVIRSPKFLSRALRGVTVNPGDSLSFTRAMLGGDIDEDGVISVFDYIVLSDYFDKTDTESDWRTTGPNGWAPIDADVDGDGSVSVFDYIVLSDHFDLSGEA